MLATRSEVEEKLRAVRGATMVTLTLYTLADTPKKVNGEENPYYKMVMKRSRINGPIGYWYANCVNNQLEREGQDRTFEAVPHLYTVHEKGGPLTFHKDDRSRIYLPIKVERVLDYQYEIDGEIQDKAIIEPWIRVKNDGSRQGTVKKTIVRNPLIESITDVAIHGEWIPVEHPNRI